LESPQAPTSPPITGSEPAPSPSGFTSRRRISPHAEEPLTLGCVDRGSSPCCKSDPSSTDSHRPSRGRPADLPPSGLQPAPEPPSSPGCRGHQGQRPAAAIFPPVHLLRASRRRWRRRRRSADEAEEQNPPTSAPPTPRRTRLGTLHPPSWTSGGNTCPWLLSAAVKRRRGGGPDNFICGGGVDTDRAPAPKHTTLHLSTRRAKGAGVPPPSPRRRSDERREREPAPLPAAVDGGKRGSSLFTSLYCS
jgi:hypothetical protein